MSADQTINGFVSTNGATPPVPVGQGQGMSRSAKARRRKAAKNADHPDTDATKLEDNHDIQKQAKSTEKPLRPRQKPANSGRGNALTKRSIENAVQLNVKPAMYSELLNAEVGELNATPFSSKSALSQTVSQSEETPSYQGSNSDTAKSITPLVHMFPVTPDSLFPSALTPEASSNPICPEDSFTTLLKPNSSAIVDQCYDNLLEMIRPQRQALLTGSQITIYIGDVSVGGIYKRSAMAASYVLHRHFDSHPESLEYRFSGGHIHPDFVRLLLVEWMQETCNEFEAHAVPAQRSFGQDVALLRTARLLGMERYCTHIQEVYVTYFKTELPSYEEIVIMEKNTLSDKDPLWTSMVNHLCHERYHGTIPDPEEFERFLNKHTRLKKAMEAADAYFARNAKKRAIIREEERRQRRQQNEAERRERVVREKCATASLKKKLDVFGSGLMTVTADEAEMLRGRTRTR